MNTVVFLGGTLTIQEAKVILPEAHYFQPAQRGDFFQLIRLHPDCIIFIDGFCDQRLAVSHKEILVALEQGIYVIGAGGFGAIRAAELNHYGMQGVGYIFQHYQSGETHEDDEVIASHKQYNENMEDASQPIVNIRATLIRAVNDQVISYEFYEKILVTAKKLNFPSRTLEKIIEILPNSSECDFLNAWLQKGNYLNISKEDAKAALALVKEKKFNTNYDVPEIYLNNTSNKLMRFVNTQAFETDYDFLPKKERYLITVKKTQPQNYQLATDLSSLALAVYELAQGKILSQEYFNNPKIEEVFLHYREDVDLEVIYYWLSDQAKQLNLSWKSYLLATEKIYPNTDSNLQIQFSYIWCYLESIIHKNEINILHEFLQQKILNLINAHHVDQNLKENLKNPQDEFHDMLMSYAKIAILFIDGNYDFLLQRHILEPKNWLEKFL